MLSRTSPSSYRTPEWHQRKHNFLVIEPGEASEKRPQRPQPSACRSPWHFRPRSQPTILFSKAPGESRMHPIIGNYLQPAVINTHREVGPHLGAELAAPGEVDLRAEINDRL